MLTGSWDVKKLVLLVSPSSSTAGRQWESGHDFVFSMDADHKQMVKFAEMDPSYDDVLSIIRDRFLPGACAVVGRRFGKFQHLESEQPGETVETHGKLPEPPILSTSKFPCVMPPYQGRASIQYRGKHWPVVSLCPSNTIYQTRLFSG